MTPDEDPDEFDLPDDGEAEDWDEETLGLDFDETDVQNVTREITSLR